MNRFIFLLSAASLAVVACSDNRGAVPTEFLVDDSFTLKFDYTPAQVSDLCSAEQKKLKESLDRVGAIAPTAATFANTVLVIENASAEFGNTLTPVNFLKYVSPREDVRAAADGCETDVSQFYVDLFTREDVYKAVQAASAKGEALDSQADQLLKEYLVSFKRNGLELPADLRKIYIEKKKALVKMEADFSTNLNEYQDELVLAQTELGGLPDAYVRGLKKTADGKYRVGLSYPEYYPFMENSTNVDARKRLEFKFSRRGGEKNRQLLQQAIQVRQQLATLLGYKNHAAYILEKQMAKNPENVSEKFLKPLIAKLRPIGLSNKQDMIEAKRKELNDPTVNEITAWDWRYYQNQLKKQKHQFDSEKVREYFPLDVVTAGMFEIYQTMLGVRFVPVTTATWFENVQLYKIVEDNKTVAYFLMDLFPREGKYGHAAAFTLVSGYVKTDGKYKAPVSSIVANFNPALPGEPSLLEHSEVETLFHEFGHIMHQTLTKARYATFSGTNVARDFVEAPSQMLENWVWEPEALAKLSGHYLDKSKHLPPDLVQKMVAAKLHNSGMLYLRQAAFATLDMEYHTQAPTDSTEVYARAMREVMGIPVQEGTYPEASFGHLMGGYDAGYYGYLWSEVYAQDMFTRFAKEGLLSTSTGADYRKFILTPGGSQDALSLITGFLGREPNQDAFLKRLGL